MFCSEIPKIHFALSLLEGYRGMETFCWPKSKNKSNIWKSLFMFLVKKISWKPKMDAICSQCPPAVWYFLLLAGYICGKIEFVWKVYLLPSIFFSLYFFFVWKMSETLQAVSFGKFNQNMTRRLYSSCPYFP